MNDPRSLYYVNHYDNQYPAQMPWMMDNPEQNVGLHEELPIEEELMYMRRPYMMEQEPAQYHV